MGFRSDLKELKVTTVKYKEILFIWDLFIFTASDFGELLVVESQILDMLLNKDSRMN